MMAFTEGKTNKECSYLGGLSGMEENKKSLRESRLRAKNNYACRIPGM